jgi:hypothetical protein
MRPAGRPRLVPAGPSPYPLCPTPIPPRFPQATLRHLPPPAPRFPARPTCAEAAPASSLKARFFVDEAAGACLGGKMVLDLQAPLLDLLSVGKDKVLIDHTAPNPVARAPQFPTPIPPRLPPGRLLIDSSPRPCRARAFVGVAGVAHRDGECSHLAPPVVTGLGSARPSQSSIWSFSCCVLPPAPLNS